MYVCVLLTNRRYHPMDYHTVRVKTPLCLSVAWLAAFVTCVLGQITVKDGYGKYAGFVVSVAPGDKYRLPISEIFNTQSTKNPRYSASGSCGGKVTLSQLSTQLSVQRIAMPEGQSVEFSAAFGRNIAFYKFTNNLVQYFTFKADPTEPKEFVSDGPYNVTFADGEKSLKCFVPVWLGPPTSRIFMACEDSLLAFKPTLDEVAGVLMFNKPHKHPATPYGQVIYFPNQDWLLGVSLTSSSAGSVSGWYCTGLTSSRLLDVQCPETLITFEYSDAPVTDTFDTVRLKKVKSGDGFLAIWSGSGESQEIRCCRLMIEDLKIVCSKVTTGGSPAAVYVDLEIEDPAVGKTGPNNYLGYFNPQTSEYRVSYFNEDKLQIQM